MAKKISIVTLTIGIVVLGSAFVQTNMKESIKRGKEVYITYCQNCHMEDGKGMPDLNPPLVKTDYLKKSTRNLISVILNGPINSTPVNSKKYSGVMPAQDYLSDEQVADVLNFIRNNWGNKIPGNITPAMVKALRKK